MSKKIETKVTILLSGDGADITVYDVLSGTEFLEMHMTPEQWCSAIGRLAYCPVETSEVRELDRVGMRHEMDHIEFEIDDSVYYDRHKHHGELARMAHEKTPAGWVPDTHFTSRDNFSFRDDKTFARTPIRRWVPVEEEGAPE